MAIMCTSYSITSKNIQTHSGLNGTRLKPSYVLEFRHNWALINDPIFGRSIQASQRRILNRDMWQNEDSNWRLVEAVGNPNDVNQIDWSAVSAAVNKGADSVMCEVRLLWLNFAREIGLNPFAGN